MKYFIKITLLVLSISIFVCCGDDNENSNALFAIKIENSKKTYQQEDELSLQITNKKNKPIENVAYAIDEGETMESNTLSLSKVKMGKRTLRAFITSEGKTYEVTNLITVTASTPPILYGYEVLERFPHDIEAYTQGLEFYGDTLYESTGQKTRSSLRKTNYKTGEVLQKVDLNAQYFGEGLTILNDKIYQLTWRENTGFIYDLKTLERKGSFVYNKSKEGWGLCNDGNKIYKSDGTEKIWTLNPNNLAEEDFIEIYTHKRVIDNVNELEWVDGKIYANIYQKDAIAIVNPSSGAVEGVINLKGLQAEVLQHTTLDVLNGIAYKDEPNILYVTGKNWDTMFKIKVVEK